MSSRYNYHPQLISCVKCSHIPFKLQVEKTYVYSSFYSRGYVEGLLANFVLMVKRMIDFLACIV